MNTYNTTRWAMAAAIVVGGMMTAACGGETTATDPPANLPVEARIYPPTDVPEVRLGTTRVDPAERRAAQNEERLRRAGGLP